MIVTREGRSGLYGKGRRDRRRMWTKGDEEVNNLHDDRDNPLIAVGVVLIATLLCVSNWI